MKFTEKWRRILRLLRMKPSGFGRYIGEDDI
jgi:hypothetical protein